MRIKDSYLHGSDLAAVIKNLIVKTGSASELDALNTSTANKTIILLTKADENETKINIPLGDITGASSSAARLSTGTTGSTTVPVYFNEGIPTVITSYSGNSTTSSNLSDGASLSRFGLLYQAAAGITSGTGLPDNPASGNIDRFLKVNKTSDGVVTYSWTTGVETFASRSGNITLKGDYSTSDSDLDTNRGKINLTMTGNLLNATLIGDFALKQELEDVEYTVAAAYNVLKSYFNENGVANSAAKLTADAGGPTTPVYFSGGVPIAITSYSGNAATASNASQLEGHAANYFATSDHTLSVDKGGTSLTTFTGVNYIPYSSSASQLTMLAPNTTTTKKYLSMTGTGTAGAAPSWTESVDSFAGKTGAITLKATSNTKGDINLSIGSNKVLSASIVGLGTNAYSSTSYLPVAGGTMTGAIKRYYGEASNDPMISLSSNNRDVWLWRINHSSDVSVATSSNYGFGLKYIGTGEGDANNLILYADNTTAVTSIAAITITQGGVVTFNSTPKVSSNYLQQAPSQTTAGYLLTSTTTAGTGAWSYSVNNSTLGNSTSAIPTCSSVANAISTAFTANDAMRYKGTIAGTSTSPGAYTPTAVLGDTYKVDTAGYIDGIYCEVGDMLICITDADAAATSSNYSTEKDKWNFILSNLNISDYVTLVGVLTISGTKTFSNLLTANGGISTSNLSAGNTILSGSLTVSGASTFSSPISCDSLLGNATTADRWKNAIKLSLTGSVTGEAQIDGSGDISLNTTTNHSHSYVNTIGISGTTLTWSINGTAQTALQLPTYVNNVTSHLYVGPSGNNNTTASTENGNTYLKLYEGSSAGESYLITGGTGIKVTNDASGNITITNTSPDINHNTDRYVNSASFTADTTNDNLVMTLTRAGSDTQKIIANIPVFTGASSSADGAIGLIKMPRKGDLGKYLRGDCTWQSIDANVTLTATDSTNVNYELLFSVTADNTTRTEGARKTQYLKYNPSTRTLSTTNITTTGTISAKGIIETDSLSVTAGNLVVNGGSTLTGDVSLGTIISGIWNGTPIANAYLANNKISIAGTDVSLGGSITAATLKSNLGLGSNAYTSTDYLPTGGGTMTGAFNTRSNSYKHASGYGINMNNSDIIGCNSIYFDDTSDNAGEGINFYRTDTTYDTIWAANGNLYFTPNHTAGAAGTDYTVYHTGNKPSKSDVGLGNVENTALSTWAGTTNITTINKYAVAGTASSFTISNKKLVNNSWTDIVDLTTKTDGTNYDYPAGTYAILITDGGNYYSGVFSVNAGNTGRLDEVALHSSMVTASDNAVPTRLFISVENRKIKAASQDAENTTETHTLTVKLVRLV